MSFFTRFARQQALLEARGLLCDAEALPSPSTRHPRKGGKIERELLEPENVAFPLTKVPPAPCSFVHGAVPFAFSALKTKAALTTGLGPMVGSTWLWFMVGDVDVTPSRSGGLDVHIAASKFQAGWVSDPTMQVPTAELRPRQEAMLQCVSDGTASKYGARRRGVPPGFSHQWRYSDSRWECRDLSWGTSRCEWRETKEVDRWDVTVSMRWGEGSTVVPGRYTIVGEQRAEKLNRNQYSTAMRGALFYVSSEAERVAALQQATAAYARAATLGV